MKSTRSGAARGPGLAPFPVINIGYPSVGRFEVVCNGIGLFQHTMISIDRTNLARTRARVRLRALYMALDIGVRARHTGYVRFLILGKGRSGSHLITLALDSHPQCIVYGELFREPDRVSWERWPHSRGRLAQSRRTRSLYRSDPVGFLERMIDNTHSRSPMEVPARPQRGTRHPSEETEHAAPVSVLAAGPQDGQVDQCHGCQRKHGADLPGR